MTATESQATPLRPSSIYPVICTNDVTSSAAFYTQYFGFEVTFEADWYVSLRSSEAPSFELAFVQTSHSSVPENFRQAAKGSLINIEVEDVDAVYASLQDANLNMPLTLRSEPSGQRHFMVEDPNGLLVDVITIIPPSPEFAAQYSETVKDELFE
ncbi:MAG: VOC family protein [Deinococcota bacterium]